MEMCLFKFLLMKVESFFYLFAKRSDSQDSSDADGRALVVNARRGVVLRHFNFRKPVKDIQFSPNRLCVMLHLFFLPRLIDIFPRYIPQFSHSGLEDTEPPSP